MRLTVKGTGIVIGSVMPSVSLCFKMHIPFQLKAQHPGTVGEMNNYFNEEANCKLVNELADECYLPANKLLMELIKTTEKEFRFSFSISGTTLELLEAYRPDVLISLRRLYNTGCVEFLAETYYNSLSCLHSKAEFTRQVRMHEEQLQKLFGAVPTVFRNTELVYNNHIASEIASMGYKAVLCESLERLLDGRSPNKIYAAPGCGDFALLLRNVRLSDDIAFRFDDPTWNEQPLTADKFAEWIHGHSSDEGNLNLFFDYETFGVHKKASTGIFDFLKYMPAAILKNSEWRFSTPGTAIKENYPYDLYDVSKTISWDDRTIENCVWCENMMQNNMLKKIYSLEGLVQMSGCRNSLDEWGRLQSADHFYHMSNSCRRNNNSYQVQNPFASPEEAYKNYLNIITDFEIKLIQKGLAIYKNENGSRPVSYFY